MLRETWKADVSGNVATISASFCKGEENRLREIIRVLALMLDDEPEQIASETATSDGEHLGRNMAGGSSEPIENKG